MKNRPLKTKTISMATNNLITNAEGKVGIPILLYFLGVPGFFVIILWALFFRG